MSATMQLGGGTLLGDSTAMSFRGVAIFPLILTRVSSLGACYAKPLANVDHLAMHLRC